MMSDKIKIEQGMPLPDVLAEKMEELSGEQEGIALILDTLISRSSLNRSKMRFLWNEIGEDFDLDGKRWKASYSPKTDQTWVFELLDSHGLNTLEDE